MCSFTININFWTDSVFEKYESDFWLVKIRGQKSCLFSRSVNMQGILTHSVCIISFCTVFSLKCFFLSLATLFFCFMVYITE